MANILLVDDDHDTTEVLSEVLRHYGHQVRTANSGEEGLQALTMAAFPDLIIVDDEMAPGMSGPAMVRQMATQSGGEAHIPFILMSGSVYLSQLSKEVGTPYSLCKPSNVDALLELMNRALADHRPVS